MASFRSGGDPEDILRGLREFAATQSESVKEAQREQFATLTLSTAVELTAAALKQVQPTGGPDEQAAALRDAMRVLFPEAVALVSAARQGFMRSLTACSVCGGRAGELVRAGHPLRVYVPGGKLWYEYSLRRLQETADGRHDRKGDARKDSWDARSGRSGAVSSRQRKPPSTTSVCPRTISASGELRNATAPAMSSGVTIRPAAFGPIASISSRFGNGRAHPCRRPRPRRR